MIKASEEESDNEVIDEDLEGTKKKPSKKGIAAIFGTQSRSRWTRT